MNLKLSNNGLSHNNQSGNCGIRALANYGGLDYAAAKTLVKTVVSIGQVNHRGMFPEEMAPLAATLGLLPLLLLESGTLTQHADVLGDGIYAIQTDRGGHLTAVVNGISIDNHDYRDCPAVRAYLPPI